ncbi:MAG: hypothetical protein K0S39_5413 [Paenibacillus sp.]|jgi:hypothetical protein|nr:hypothetical protein [Paenibacillus sp.]
MKFVIKPARPIESSLLFPILFSRTKAFDALVLFFDDFQYPDWGGLSNYD